MGQAAVHVMNGELSAAARLVDQERLMAEATGTPRMTTNAMMLAAWRGREQEAADLIAATVREATAREQGYVAGFAKCSSAVLYNALGRYEAARDAVLQGWGAWEAPGQKTAALGVFAVPELAEAAARTGDVPLVAGALEWLTERTQVEPTGWVLGIQARVRALLGGGDAAADASYLASIEYLARTCVRVQLARSHLLYGEWLRRQNRRLDARAHLRTAHDMLSAMGAEGFAERARRELMATGETVRRRTAETASDLTDQEAHIARLAVDGRTNQEIGAQLYLSARTVEWHLRKVYTKLGVGSRRDLRLALANYGQAEPPHPGNLYARSPGRKRPAGSPRPGLMLAGSPRNQSSTAVS
jgi:DNA-binding CsgD family transcriptional regulator